jgi:hypothetical protein
MAGKNTGQMALIVETACAGNIRHAFRNFENRPARTHVLLSPGGFEQFMRAMIGRSPCDVPALEAEYHLEIAGPPISAASD